MRAPEFPKNLTWLNSKSLTMVGLRGHVVLIDFWTYSCVNCFRTLPFLKEWHKRYKDKGLVIVGVHTPEFDFEKAPANVQKAVQEFGLEYPIVLDSDYLIWNLWSNQWWPRKFLVNKDGKVVYDHVGEGGYEETEREIQKALVEINPAIEVPEPTHEKGAGGICYPATPETYLGSQRGQTGKVWNYQGEWAAQPEYIEHTGSTKEYQDKITLNFESYEVNLVMESDKAQEILLKLNGQELGKMRIRDSKMYRLFEADKFTAGTLEIFAKEPGLRAYAFTFSGCKS